MTVEENLESLASGVFISQLAQQKENSRATWASSELNFSRHRCVRELNSTYSLIN